MGDILRIEEAKYKNRCREQRLYLNQDLPGTGQAVVAPSDEGGGKRCTSYSAET